MNLKTLLGATALVSLTFAPLAHAEIVIGLIQNAFFKAILPGFEREFASTHPAK